MPQQKSNHLQRVNTFVQELLQRRDEYQRKFWMIQILVGIPMLLLGYYFGSPNWHLIQYGTKSFGQVSGIKEFHSGSTRKILPVIDYEVNGKKFSFVGQRVGRTPSIGTSIPILVDVNQPELVMMDHFVLNWMPWGFFFSIGLLLIFSGTMNRLRRPEPPVN